MTFLCSHGAHVNDAAVHVSTVFVSIYGVATVFYLYLIDT